MGALNIIRMLTEAMIAGYRWDTQGSTLTLLPEVNNSGSLQVNDGTRGMDVKIVLGNTSKHALFDVSENTIYINTADIQINLDDGYIFSDTSTGILQVNAILHAQKIRQRTIISSGTTTLTEADFGKVIMSATNHKHLTLPTPVGNAGAWMEVMNVITRNTVLQCVNATGAKFGWNGDNAVHTIRINSAGDWIRLVSSDVDWYVGNLGADPSHVVPNIAASF